MGNKPDKAAENIAWLKAKEKEEPVARFLDIELLELTPGYARVRMKVKPEYHNFHGLTFGGIIMAVSDQAFAYASNSLAYPSVASNFNTSFMASAKSGDELVAECRVIKSGKRAGFSEITVTNQDDRLIARSNGITIPVGNNES
ncbi:PaaI family thioesterase [Chloroflexota bacterium]